MIGKIRIPQRNARCPKCEGLFEDIGKKGYVCPDCLTVPDRYYLDLHYRGKRVKVFCDKQGRPLDSFDRAFDLLAHINYEINDHSFDPSKYIKSEQKEFYVCTQIERYSDNKFNFLAPSYQTDFKRNIGLAKEFFHTKDVREIRKVDILGFESYLRENFKLSNKTIKNIMDVFKSFLNHLKNNLEMITIVPKFPDIEIVTKPIRWFSEEDQATFFELMPEWAKPIVSFLVLHGCRPSEARALKCKDVDIARKAITISATFSGTVYREKRKGRKSKAVRVPIHSELFNYISYRVLNNLPEAFVFPNPHTGRPFGKNALDRMWNRIRKKAGLDKGVRLYDFTRHSFGSNLDEHGVSTYRISKLMGHSSVKMTEKYCHSDVERLRVSMEKLSLNRHQTVIRDIVNVK